MQKIFQTVALREPNFIQKILNKLPKENAILELNNLLASKSLLDISRDEIQEIQNKYSIIFPEEFAENISEFYAALFKSCLNDNNLSEDDKFKLEHFRRILNVNEDFHRKIENSVGISAFTRIYNSLISKGEINEAEENLLKDLQSQLKISDSEATNISFKCRQNYMDDLLKKIVADRMVSPDEWNDFTETARKLKVSINIEGNTSEQLNRLKKYWLIENSDLEKLPVNLSLQNGEYCYYTCQVDWLEYISITKRINYSGFTYSHKILKGLSYRVGSINLQKITANELKVIDTGKLFFTNKRVIFMGAIKNINIKLNRILSITPYSDGVEIEKDSGKSPVIRVAADADILTAIFSRLIKDSL